MDNLQYHKEQASLDVQQHEKIKMTDLQSKKAKQQTLKEKLQASKILRRE